MAERHTIKRGVSLYSFQEEYFLRKMSLEDILAVTAELGSQGVEIIGDQMIPNYPHISTSFYDQWQTWLEEYKLTPTCLDMFLDWNKYKGRVMSDEEKVQSVLNDIQCANRLGCTVIRVITHTEPNILERLAPYAEKYNVRLGVEIHSPFHFDHAYEQSLLAMYQKVQSPYLGFVPDMGIFVKRFPRVISERWVRDGMKPEIAHLISEAYDKRALDHIGEEVARSGGSPEDVARAEGASRFIFTDARRMLDFMPYIFHIHAKFYEMLPEYREYSIPYEDIIPVLVEGGYDGYLSASTKATATSRMPLWWTAPSRSGASTSCSRNYSEKHSTLKAKHSIKRGVSLYSFQEEYYLRKMSLEDILATTQKLDIPGIEIIGDQMIPNYPYISEDFFEQWHAWMDKYGCTPVCLDMYLDWNKFKGRSMTEDEKFESVMLDIRNANKLGCHVIRVSRDVDARLLERLAPEAEKHQVTLALEIYAPDDFDSPEVQHIIAMFECVRSSNLGFTLDMSLFCKRLPRVASDRLLREGLKDEIVDYLIDAYNNHTLPKTREFAVSKPGQQDYPDGWDQGASQFGISSHTHDLLETGTDAGLYAACTAYPRQVLRDAPGMHGVQHPL